MYRNIMQDNKILLELKFELDHVIITDHLMTVHIDCGITVDHNGYNCGSQWTISF